MSSRIDFASVLKIRDELSEMIHREQDAHGQGSYLNLAMYSRLTAVVAQWRSDELKFHEFMDHAEHYSEKALELVPHTKIACEVPLLMFLGDHPHLCPF